MKILLIFIKQKIINSFPDSLLVGVNLLHLVAVIVVEVLEVEVAPFQFPVLEVGAALFASQIHHLHPIAIGHKCCLVVYVFALGVVLPLNQLLELVEIPDTFIFLYLARKMKFLNWVSRIHDYLTVESFLTIFSKQEVHFYQ